MTKPLVFRQKNGLSAYALACGHIQRAAHTIGNAYELRVDLFHDGGAYHVRAHEHGGRGRLLWDSFESIANARRCWEKSVIQHLGERIRQAKADRRYSVAQEFTGERDPFYVARIEGAPRSSWIGKSATAAGAWLLVAADKENRARELVA